MVLCVGIVRLHEGKVYFVQSCLSRALAVPQLLILLHEMNMEDVFMTALYVIFNCLLLAYVAMTAHS